jgi:predicted PurR-regulated permease PerM
LNRFAWKPGVAAIFVTTLELYGGQYESNYGERLSHLLPPNRPVKITFGLVAAVAVVAALAKASTVFAPLALALFIIALVWPLQRWLQVRIPKLLALGVTVVVTVSVFLAFASLIAWGFGRVTRSIISELPHYQALFDRAVTWLDGHGISVAGLWAEHFNVGWLLRVSQRITDRVNATLTFWLITLLYVILGLLEVDNMRSKLEALHNRDAARVLLHGSTASALRFRRYMLVRTQMSAVTGLLVGAFAWVVGLRFPLEWGVIAFALNYIPFIGSFIATLFPTVLAMIQLNNWQAVLGIFICLNVIQFVVGSYVEPRVSGNVLGISPFAVIFTTFLWTYLWGLIGTFIGVPIAVAILTFCDQHPSSRWVADLLGAPTRTKPPSLS